MDYRYKLRENDDEGNFSRPKEEPKVTLIVKDVDAALKALDDIKNYGKHAVTNARQDSKVEKNIDHMFGPVNKPLKGQQERLFSTLSKEEWIKYFADKLELSNKGSKNQNQSKESILADIEAKYDILKNNNGKYHIKMGGPQGSLTKAATDSSAQSGKKPTLLPEPKIKDNKIIFNKTDDDISLDRIKDILRTVMNTANIIYKIEGDKEPKSTKESKEKELRLLIREEIRNLLNEENSSITIEGISATGKGYTVWEGNKPIGDLRQKIGSYRQNGFGEINVGGNTFDFYYVTQIKTDKLPYIKSLKDHVGRAAYFTVSAQKDSGISKDDLKAVADNILEKNKNQDGITILK